MFTNGSLFIGGYSIKYILPMLIVLLFTLIALVDPSITFFFIFFYVIGLVVCFYLSNYKCSDFKRLSSIFFYSSFLYFAYAIFAYANYIGQDHFFLFPDQSHFFESSEYLKQLGSLSDIFNTTIINKMNVENEGFYFLNGAVAYIFHNFINGNSVLIQSLLVASFAVFINILVYKILVFYVENDIAYKYTLLFALFSVVFAYSPWILRDIHILFFYTLGFYLIHKDFDLKVLFLILIVQAVVLEFRLSSGLAFSFFPIYYVFFVGARYKYKIYLYSVLSLFSIPVIYKTYNLIVFSFTRTQGRLERYVDYTNDSVSASGGLSAIIYSWPSGIKEFFIVLLSQMQPFPPWAGIEKASSFFENFMIFVFGVSGVFWFYVIYVTVLSFIKNYKLIPKQFFIFLAFFVLFLATNTTNMNPRRIMAVYPMVYTFFVFSQVYFNSNILNKRRVFFVFIYSFLIVLYLFMAIF